MATAVAAHTQSAAAAAAAPALAAEHPAPLQLLLAFLAVQEERARLYSSFHAAFRRYLATGEEGTYVRAVQALTVAFADCSQQVRALEAKLAAPDGTGGAGRPDLAALLRAVQNGEADKLKLTVSWQALRKAATPLELATAGGGPVADTTVLEQPLQQLAIEAAAGAATANCGHHGHYHTGDHCSHGERDAPAGAGSQRHACDQLNAARCGSSKPAAAGATAGACGSAAAAANSSLAPHVAAAAAGAYGPDGVVVPLVAEVEAASCDAARGLDDAIAAINEALEEVRYAVQELREADDV